MCPIPNGEIPLIITSPGGIEGVHLPAVSFDYFKGMSKEASKKLYDQIWSEIITDKNIYEHWYKNDKDILIFCEKIFEFGAKTSALAAIFPSRQTSGVVVQLDGFVDRGRNLDLDLLVSLV